MPETLRIRVTGMGCGGCEDTVKRSLQQVEGIEGVTASYKAGLVGVSFDAERVTTETIRARIEAAGYTVVSIS